MNKRKEEKLRKKYGDIGFLEKMNEKDSLNMHVLDFLYPLNILAAIIVSGFQLNKFLLYKGNTELLSFIFFIFLAFIWTMTTIIYFRKNRKNVKKRMRMRANEIEKKSI